MQALTIDLYTKFQTSWLRITRSGLPLNSHSYSMRLSPQGRYILTGKLQMDVELVMYPLFCIFVSGK